MTERIGLYPGTFDPITLGHADIIRRGAKLVDRLIVGVTTNPAKDPMFSPEERIEMVQQLDANVETVFLMADVSLQPIASRLVKEIALFGGDIAPFVSREVCELVEARVTTLGRRGDF